VGVVRRQRWSPWLSGDTEDRPAIAAVAGLPGSASDFGLLRNLQGVIHLNAEVTYG